VLTELFGYRSHWKRQLRICPIYKFKKTDFTNYSANCVDTCKICFKRRAKLLEKIFNFDNTCCIELSDTVAVMIAVKVRAACLAIR